MNRRELLGCLTAVFCGTLLPEPVRKTIRIATTEEVAALTFPDGADAFVVEIKNYTQVLCTNRSSFGKIVSLTEEDYAGAISG
jgi:hypothetical protein